VLQNPDLAPYPQFPLSRGKPQSESAPSHPVICSLRTMEPPTTPKESESGPFSFSHPLLPSTMVLQKNLTATLATKQHKITWSYDDNILPDSVDGVELEELGRGRVTAEGNFVRNMKVGDTVTVWAKARFQGWLNSVEEVKIDIYWAV
jgi:hypothetical protein